jgi:signal transduction histidine kinase
LIHKPLSLAKRLTKRLILLQVVTLTIFAICVPTIDFLVGDRTFFQVNPEISDDIADSLQWVDGQVTVVPNEDLDQLMEAAPSLWFVIVTETGERLQQGEVPEALQPMAQTIDQLDIIALREDSVSYRDALIKVEGSDVGDVIVFFGQGPLLNPFSAATQYAAGKVFPVLLVILLILGTTTSLAIPSLVRRSLTGLRQAVSHAESINLQKPGTRLPTTDVPSEITALVDAMNDALARIDADYLRQKRFLADAAHELRTPIAILQNRIELLKPDEVGNRLLLDIQRIANLAEQLLDLQRLDHPGADFREVDLVPLARQVVADLAPMAINSGYEPHFDNEADSVVVMGDSNAIERAIINLVQNAIAYGGNRGRVRVEVRRDRSIEVSDDGDGVAPEHREMIFEPFNRVRPTDRGAGLGLNLVREIMRRHNGSVSVVESTSGGACFVLRFFSPRAQRQPE